MSSTPRSRRRIAATVASASLLCVASPAAAHETGFLDRSLTLAGHTYRYQVYVPRDAATHDRLPIVLALHGAGERGSDGLLQTEVGLANAVRRFPDRWRAIIVFAQAPAETIWQGRVAEAALAELAQEERAFRTDPARVYLTGLSLGGSGAWYLAYHHPERFAAIVPVCGFVTARADFRLPAVAADADPYAAVAARIARVPAWIVHGADDEVVPVEESRRMAAALKAAGADVHYNEIPGVDHASWVPGYADPALPAWLFRQHRP